MKTSKIILIAFLSFFCMGMLSFLITTETKSTETESIEEATSEYSVIKVSKGTNVTIHSSNTNSIMYSYLKDSAFHQSHEIIADTLILKPYKQNGQNWSYDVNTNNKIDIVINNGGKVGIKLQQDSLRAITNNKGRFQVYDKSSIAFLDLKISENSRAYLSNPTMNQFNLMADNSEVDVSNSINIVNITAINEAHITLRHVKKLHAECDETSSYRLY